MFPHGFRRANQGLSFTRSQLLVVALGNHSPVIKNNWNQINDLSYLKCKHRKDFLCLENLMKIISNLATYIPNVNSDAKIFYFFRLPLWCVDQL